MMQANEIFNESIPTKKMLARMENNKCKVYIDNEGQCDIISTACIEKFIKENVEIKYQRLKRYRNILKK